MLKQTLVLYCIIFCLVFLNACSKGDKNRNTDIPPSVKTSAIEASTESCKTFIKRLDSDFAKVPNSFYDYINVPENPNDPTSKTIQIFYYGRTVPGQTPVVFFNGGPAGNSHSSYVILTSQQKNDKTWAEIPLIFIDQRGTGCSDAYPQGKTDDILQRLMNYGTRAIVNDAELIRKKLNIGKWKIFGQSYGAFLVHRYMTIVPQSVVAAFAHAGIITSDPIERFTGRIRSQNRVIEAYLLDFPSDRTVLETLNAKLTPGTCFHSSANLGEVCGTEVLDPFLAKLGFTDDWIWIHLNLNRLVKNNQLNEARIQEFLNKNVFVPTEVGRSTGTASKVIGWVDRNMPNVSKLTCKQVYANLTALGDKPDSAILNDCTSVLKDPSEPKFELQKKIQTLPQDLLTIADFKQALTQHPEIPFYLYVGAKDPYVPVDDFKEELDAINTLVHYTYFLGTGHDGFYTEPQVWDELAQ